jgi:hypothetical protein
MPTQNRPGDPHQQVRPVPDTVPARERMRMPQIERWILKHDFDAAPYAAIRERTLAYLPGVLAASGVRVAGGTPPQWLQGVADYRFVSELGPTTYGLPLWYVIAEKGDVVIRDPWVPAEDLQRAWQVVTPESASIAIVGEVPSVVVGVGLRLSPAVAEAIDHLKEIWPLDGVPPSELSDYGVIELLKTHGVSRSTGQRALEAIRLSNK